jgi:hypothetical protein
MIQPRRITRFESAYKEEPNKLGPNDVLLLTAEPSLCCHFISMKEETPDSSSKQRLKMKDVAARNVI